MSKSYQDEQDFIYNGPINCQCAYAYGEKGFTALSNIVENSPLFYMEFSYDDENFFDDDLLELEELRAELLEGEIDELVQEKHQKLMGAARHLSQYQKVQISDLLAENIGTLSKEQKQKPRKEKAFLKEALAILSKSKLGAELLNFAENKNIKIEVSQHVFNVFYDREDGKILVNPNLKTTKAIAGLARSLRMMWNHKQGLLIHPLYFQPDDAILLSRIHAADLSMIQIRTAWELKLAGENEAWNEIMASLSYDIASAFAREAISDFRNINNGTASLAAFESWFLSGRCKATDKVLIQTMLADHHGMVFEQAETSKNVTMEIIAGLGELPMGKNYLSSIVYNIIEDPLYAEVRDRSNSNFLWFIKFERSFKETEQNLQTQEGQVSSAAQSAHSSVHKDHNNDQESQDIILFKPLPVTQGKEEDRKLSAQGKSQEDQSSAATIYYLEHFRNVSRSNSV